MPITTDQPRTLREARAVPALAPRIQEFDAKTAERYGLPGAYVVRDAFLRWLMRSEVPPSTTGASRFVAWDDPTQRASVGFGSAECLRRLCRGDLTPAERRKVRETRSNPALADTLRELCDMSRPDVIGILLAS